MKWLLIKSQEIQLCSQQMLTKVHKVFVNRKKIQYVIIYHYHNYPQILKIASVTHTKWILNREQKHIEIYQKVSKKLLQRQNIINQINSRFMPPTDLKIGKFVLIPNFKTQKGISKKIQPIQKGQYQIIDKPTEVTYKLTDSNKKEIVQHRNNLLPYYPKEYALREFTQLYIFCRFKNRSKKYTDRTKSNLK